MPLSVRSALFLLVLAAPTTVAGDTVARHLLIPIVGRAPGAHGSQWQTDLVVSNVGADAAEVGVLFHAAQFADGISFSLRPGETRVLRDFIRETFGVSASSGYARIAASEDDARISARARIYNVGGHQGQFGQIVPAIGASALTTLETSLTGLSGVGGNRTNVGISNPSSTTADLSLTLFSESGQEMATITRSLPAQRVLQFDLFHEFGVAPIDGASVRIRSSRPVATYASIVRSDSGDADFVSGAEVDRPLESVVPPQCGSPATLRFSVHPAPGFIVVFKDGVNATETTAELAERFEFTPRHVYEHALSGFAAEISPQVVAAIRCESTVSYIEENTFAFIE